jgi:sulfur carrier protein ThiS
MMIVRVRLFANLVQYRPNTKAGKPFDVELVPASTLADLVAHLELPCEQVKVIFINGIAVSQDHVIQPGDEIGIFSPIGGG